MKDPLHGVTPFNLLIGRMSALGDIIHTLPAYHALKKRYPRTRFSWMVDEPYRHLLESFDELEVVSFDRPEVTKELKTLQWFWKAVGLILAFAHRLYRMKLVAAIVFQPLLRSSLFARLSFARVRIGFNRFAEGGWLLNNVRISVSRKQHAIMQNLSLLQPMGVDMTPNRVSIPLSEENHKVVQDFLLPYKLSSHQIVAICPCSSKKIKQWRIDAYAELADRISNEQGLTPIILWYGNHEEAVAKEIIGRMKQKGLLGPRMNLLELAAFFEQCAYVVSPDTGPLHLAAAQKTPVVGLYGPTDPMIHGPFWEPNRVVRHNPTCNRACYKKRNHSAAICQCMQDLSVEKVFNACESLLEQIRNEKKKSA